MEKKPVLSIGIMFKNEIRCLERCLKSLRPLREAIPCEVVMADTGSTDGSRATAEQYADILIDFPWRNDFAAARNAILDRCSGSWCLTVDADEWLDEDISELTAFLRSWDGRPYVLGAVVVRNYSTYDFSGSYLDFFATRLACMAEGPRYVGAIHERWEWPGREVPNTLLRHTVLHHDGYVEMNTNGEAGRRKQARNMTLLREKLKREPENLMVYLQMVESGRNEPDYLDILRQAVKLVEERKPYWEMLGPPILRYAVTLAGINKLPERGEWIQKAEEWFPNSAFIQIDVAFQAFSYFLERDEFEEAARRGEIYLKALEEDRAGRLDPSARLRSAVQTATPLKEQAMKISLADVYRRLDRVEEAMSLLSGLEFSCLDESGAGKLAQVLMNLQLNTGADLSELVVTVWEGISAPVPNRTKAEVRKNAFAKTVFPAFSSQNRCLESGSGGFIRHTYAVFLPLKDRCELGRGAAILETEDADLMRQTLAGTEEWQLLPGDALGHALAHGVDFPLPEKPLKLEEMDHLAAWLAREPELMRPALQRAVERMESPQALAWARGLVLAAIQVSEWEEEEQDMNLARVFAEIERKFLPVCYAPDALREENLFLLPPLHRLGWHCAHAFAALDGGDAVGYARHLRAGLAACAAAKPMVEFLTRHTPQLREAAPSPELRELAEKVHGMLASFSPDDPAVAALKNSPAYQKAAHLIEAETDGN